MRVCLITPGQPSNNPRLVKEADALAEAGHSVHALCADCGLWPSLMDRDLMAHRSWTYSYAAGNPRRLPGLSRRIRHKVAMKALRLFPQQSAMELAAISHAAPELMRAALRYPADLYIAHHPVALPAAAKAARKFNAKFGCDVEDFYTCVRQDARNPSTIDNLMERVERRYLASCDYVTAASPGFATAYAAKYGISPPPAILNVFPLSERPQTFRPCDPAQPLRLYWFSQCIGENRGLEDVIRALGSLRDDRIELHLRGNWRSGYQEHLRSFAASVGTDWSRITAHSPASPDEMVRLSAEYDVGLAIEQPIDANRDLCLTNKLFVYLLAGNAVAATETTGQKPIVETLEEAAFCYQPGDIERLAAGLRLWSRDRSSLDQARKRAWRWGTQTFNWDIEKASFLKVVNSVMGCPAPELISAAAESGMAGFSR